MRRQFSFAGRIARWLLARRRATIVHMIFPEARRDLELIRETRARVHLRVEDAAALEILAHVRAARRFGHCMAEAGVFAGGTARLICEVKGDAPLHLFDVFETLQSSPSAMIPGGPGAEVEALFGTSHVPKAKVERLLAPYQGVHFHAGLFPGSAQGLEDLRFSFVHLDFDLERSTKDALDFFYPRLCRGGILIGDDYNLAGVRKAFDEHFASRPDTVIALPWAQVVVVKL